MVRALESKNCYCCLVIISSIISLFLDFWSSDDWPGFSYDSNSLFLRNSNTSRKEETLGEVYKVESDIWFVCCTIRVWNPQALRLLCCRRSSRGHDCWLTWAIRGSLPLPVQEQGHTFHPPFPQPSYFMDAARREWGVVETSCAE